MTKVRKSSAPNYTIEKMNRIQMKVLLDFLGLPFSKQPRVSEELAELLKLARIDDESKFCIGYDAIVNHVFPEAEEGRDVAIAASENAEMLEKLVSEKINTYEGAAIENVKTLARNHFSSFKDNANVAMKTLQTELREEIKKAAEEVKRIEIVHHVKVGTDPVVQLKEVLPEAFDTLLQLAVERQNILMVGPAGCGKTHTASLLAKALNLPYASQSCSAGMSESALIGWLLPTGANGKFAYVQSKFVELYENGGVFLLDEIDGADPNVLIYINQALANDSFFLPQRFEKPEVKKHKDFIAIAAANTFGTGATALYTARNSLDAATLDRFKVGTVEMEYSAAIEEKLVDAELLKWGRQVRSCINKHGLRQIMSTRVLLDATKMKRNQNWSVAKIHENYLRAWSKEERAIVNGSVIF